MIELANAQKEKEREESIQNILQNAGILAMAQKLPEHTVSKPLKRGQVEDAAKMVESTAKKVRRKKSSQQKIDKETGLPISIYSERKDDLDRKVHFKETAMNKLDNI